MLKTPAAVVAALLVIVAGSTPLRSQQRPQGPTFTSSVQYVEVDVRVLDKQGNPVRDLTRRDFRVLEDGVEQSLDTFVFVDQPIVTPDAPLLPADVLPDVATNAGRDQGMAGRLYVLLLDDRQIDATRTQTTIQIARRFIEHNLGPRDLLAVVTSSGRTDVSQSFSSHKPSLLKSVDGFIGRKLPSAAIAALGAAVSGFQGNGPMDNAERYHEARSALQALARVCEWLAGIKGVTKSVILVSEGLNYDYESNPVADPYATEILAEQRLTIAAATRANVTVYPIDPRGLGNDDSILVGAVGDSGPVRITAEIRQETERAHASLREIALSTGGVEALNTNKLPEALDRIVKQSSTYYLLGYHPKNARREGKFRSIRVSVNRPGTTVSSRRGYAEPSAAATSAPAPTSLTARIAGASADLSDALNSPLPLAGITLTMTAAAFRGEDGLARVAAIIESPNLAFNERDGKFNGAVEIVTAAIDGSNTIVAGKFNKIGFALSPETFQQMTRQGFRTLAGLDGLKPGRYEIRIAAADRESSKLGNLWYPFEVPDFSRGPLTISGLILASQTGTRTPTGNPDKLFDPELTVPPTVVREFRAGDELTLFAEIYDNNLSPPHQVDLRTTLRTADGREAFSADDWASHDELAAASGAYGLTVWIPLKDVPPGDYALTLEATRQVADREPVRRSLPIRVLP